MILPAQLAVAFNINSPVVFFFNEAKRSHQNSSCAQVVNKYPHV